jgi:hypothetical protein
MVFINRIIVAVVLLFTSLSYAAESTPVKIRAGFASIAAGHALIWVTKESGIFQKNGLDADLVYLQNPSLCAQVRIPMKSPPIPKQTGTHCGTNRQSEKSERSDAGNFVHSLGFSELQGT